ncbi:MAG: alkyl sulfatase dimerization domain-containing protein, partial [Raoultibacter sp.]
LRGAAATAAAFVIPATLAGCGNENSGAAGKAASSKPLTDEQRALATPDPSYMGGKINYCGQEVKVGTGKYGQIANQKMIDHHVPFDPPQLVKVTDRIYTSVGNSLSNSTLVIGDTGIIVIDTGDCIEAAQMDFDAFRKVTDKPVVAVIYTHSHYCNGTRAYIPEGSDIPVITQERLMEALTNTMNERGGFFVERGYHMFGAFLPLEGEDGSVGGGTGAFLFNPHVKNPTTGFVAPTETIPFNESMVEKKIDGLTFRFFPSVADDVGNINMYVVEEDTVIANQLWGVFWNMYTIRGQEYRDPINSTKCIDTLIALDPENFVSVHGMPVLGHDKVIDQMTRYRDGIQFVYDQTIRYMNKGFGPDDIVAKVRIPEHLVSGQLSQAVYGEIEHYVRGVYSGLVGWFGADAIELHPISKAFASERIVAAMGGKEAVIAEANHVLEDKQYVWAATLATYVLDIDKENKDAKKAKAQAFRKIAQVTEATNTRHYYMTQALELEGTLDRSLAPAWITKDKLMAAPRDLILNIMRVALIPEKLNDINEVWVLTFADEGVSNTLHIRNNIGCVVPGKADKPTVELSVAYPDMLGAYLKETSIEKLISSGKATVTGDKAALDTILAACEVKL